MEEKERSLKHNLIEIQRRTRPGGLDSDTEEVGKDDDGKLADRPKSPQPAMTGHYRLLPAHANEVYC